MAPASVSDDDDVTLPTPLGVVSSGRKKPGRFASRCWLTCSATTRWKNPSSIFFPKPSCGERAPRLFQMRHERDCTSALAGGGSGLERRPAPDA